MMFDEVIERSTEMIQVAIMKTKRAILKNGTANDDSSLFLKNWDLRWLRKEQW